MRRLLEIAFFVITLGALAMTQTGCAGLGKKLKAWVGGEAPVADADPERARRPPSFSSTPRMGSPGLRQYRRVTKESFAQDQGLEDNAGSLWRREGQSAFLFTQNNLRNLGDIVNVKIEERTAQDLAVKTEVIKSSFARAAAKAARKRKPASSPVGSIPKPAEKAEPEEPKAAAAKETAPGGAPEGKADVAEAGAKKEEAAKFDVTDIPARITERFSDGSYRLKGVQAIMIDRKEYKVMVTGVVKPEDINSDKVGSTKILDGKFDIVAGPPSARESGL